MMHPFLRRISVVAFTLLCPTFAALAQIGSPAGGQQNDFKETDPYEKLDRKEPSMWHNPHENSPVAELARAARFEKEGRRSAAISANNALVHEWHHSREAVIAQRNLARLLEEDGEYEDAFLEYQYLIVYFAGQFPFLDVLDHQYRCANSLCNFDNKFLGITTHSLSDVRKMYERLLINGPNWEKAPEVAMRIGQIREAADEAPEAAIAYEQVQNRFPNTPASHDAAYRTAICRSQFALTHPRDAKSRTDAVAALNAFLKKYPGDSLNPGLRDALKDLEQQTVEAAYAQAFFYDHNRHDRAAAIAAYRDFLRRYPDAPQAKEVAARLQLLESNTPVTQVRSAQ